MTETLLRIGELATRAAVSPRTIDYYTGLGLLTPAERTAGRFRLYQHSDVDRVQLVQRLEAQGMPLEEITTALKSSNPNLEGLLARIDDDLEKLRTVAESATPEISGLLAALATRVQSLITVALQLPPIL